MPDARTTSIAGAALAVSVLVTIAGCGGAGRSDSVSTTRSTVPSYVSQPFTPEQQLIARGAQLVVTDGCSACHLTGLSRRLAPSFSSFAGHPVTLSDGRRAIVDQAFVRRALSHPGELAIAGYDPTPMIATLARLHLSSHPGDIAALAAFIEQVGAE